MVNEKPLHTLIPLGTFKALLSIGDREDKTCRFCFVTATHTIEHYCKRKLLWKMHSEQIEFTGDLFLPLREYPVSKILAVFLYGTKEILEPEFYQTILECGTDEDIPFSLSLPPALNRYRGLKAIQVVYWAGYMPDKISADLSAACIELAAWNMNRYRGKRIGMIGNIRGAGKEGEHFEMSMPENVKTLLDPYVRRTI